MQCICRDIKTNGKRCANKRCLNTNYCIHHIHIKNPLFEYLLYPEIYQNSQSIEMFQKYQS